MVQRMGFVLHETTKHQKHFYYKYDDDDCDATEVSKSKIQYVV